MKIHKITTNIFAIILPLLIFVSCSAPTDATTTGIISGTVLNAETSQPVEGVMVTTSPNTSTKTSDNQGTFLFEDIEPGTYTVQASKTGFNTNSTTTIVTAGKTASANIQLNQVPPELSVFPTSLDFSSSATTLPVTISNSGMNTLEWSVTENAGWITVSPTSGSITSSQATVTITIDRSGLNPDDYSETISISSNGGSAVISVSMIVQGPVLSVSNKSLNFGTSGSTLTFNIANTGVGSLTYNLVYTAGWLSVIPTTGSATTETDVMTVSVDRSGLTPGNYVETITVTSNANSETVDVLMTVANTSSSQLSAYPAALDFENADVENTFFITNTGTGTLSWNITDDKSWISYDPNSGTTTTEADAITVSVDRLGLTPGTYTGTITITSDGGNQNINIYLTVPNEPSLSISPSALDFGSEETTLTFDVANAGTDNLNWSVTDNQDWINVNPLSGTNLGTVNVTVSRDGLSPGDYSGLVTVSSNGGTRSVEILMNVPADNPLTSVTLQAPSEITETSLKLSWSRNFDTDFAAYYVYRALTPAVTQSSELIATITNSAENYYTDTNLQSATTYYYRIFVMDMAQQYTASNVVSGTTKTAMGNWSVTATLGTSLFAVDALNENYAIAVGDGGKIFYFNGSSWSEETSPTTRDLHDVKIFSQADVWAVGNDGVFHFDGTNWSQPEGAPTDYCYSISGTNPDSIWVGGSSGRIYFYNGSSWSEIQVSASNVIDIQMINANNGWCLSSNGKIFHFKDSGWSQVHDSFGGTFKALYVFSSSNIWIGGSHYLSNDDDGNKYNGVYHWNGTSWLDIFDSYYSYGFEVQDFDALSETDIWIVKQFFSSSYTGIMHWDGNTIQSVTSPVSKDLFAIKMLSNSSGWIVGEDGVVLRYHRSICFSST